MTAHTNMDSGKKHQKGIIRSIERLTVSRRRIKYGETISVAGETTFIADGTKLTIEVWEQDSGDDDDKIDSFEVDVKDAKFEKKDYKIEWDDPDPEDIDGYQVYFIAKNEDLELESDPSEIVLVDRSGFQLSM